MQISGAQTTVRWLMPSLSQWLWLIIFLVLLTQPWRIAMVAADGDACFHWQTGDVMLQRGEIIHADIFSHTRPGAPLISKEWLSEIVFAVAGRSGGLFGLSLIAALVIATTFALLHHQLVRDGNDLLVATLVTLVAMWASTTHWLARPHAFSFLMILLWNDALRRYENTRSPGRLLAALVVLAILWVNLHGAFLAGFFILGAYWLGAVIDRDLARVGHLTLAGLVSGLATLLNPSGYHLHLHNIAFLRGDFFPNWLAEYLTLDFQKPAAQGFLAWLALLFLTLALVRPRWRASAIMLLISWGYFALYSGRNVPLFAILTAPLLAPALSERLRAAWPQLADRGRAISDTARGWPLVGAIALGVLLLVPHPTQMPDDNWPVTAVDYIRQHPDEFRGRMFNQYSWGGYLIKYLPEHKVFIDGRADFYGEQLAKDFSKVTSLKPGWPEPLDKYQIQWTLMPVDHRLREALALAPGWRPVYADGVAIIYRRDL